MIHAEEGSSRSRSSSALPISEKMRSAQVLLSDVVHADEQALELSEYPKYAEMCLPWHKLDTIQVTELEIDDATAELEKAQLMKRAEESAKRWAGKTFDLRMSTDALGSIDLFTKEFQVRS